MRILSVPLTSHIRIGAAFSSILYCKVKAIRIASSPCINQIQSTNTKFGHSFNPITLLQTSNV